MIFSKKQVPKWQKAIETEDIAYLEKGCQKKTLFAPSPLGFFCHEIAYFLDKKKALAILAKRKKLFTKKRFFYVQPKGAETVEKIEQKEFEIRFSCLFSPSLHFSDLASMEMLIKRCPWLFRSFFTRGLFDMGDISRQCIHEQQVADIAIQWVDDVVEYGLFTRKAVQKGTFIGEYTGHVREIDKQAPDLNCYCAKYPTKFFSKGYFVIDASKYGNEMRFVNHSDTPNLSAVYICDRNILHLAFIAKEDIVKGQELTIKYGKDFWRKRTKVST